ncbi:MAG: hypothetical protein WBI20_11555 [Burkholderiaceae bacterium]
MPFLRQTQLIARFMLAWFVLSVGVAIASPMVKPQVQELICAGAGVMKMQTLDDEGTLSSPTLDCPWCAASNAAPPLASPIGMSQLEPVFVAPYDPAERPSMLVAAPLPARGPPVFS